MAKTHLGFLLSETRLHVANISEGNFVELGQLEFQGKKDFQYKEQIQAFLQDLKIDQHDYDEYSLSWFTPFSTLVPTNIFGASDSKTVFQACFTKEMIANDIDYNRISELSIVNIYEIPLWVKSFFVIRYPRIVIQHEASVFLRGIFATSTFKLGIHILLHDSHCCMVFVKENELKFYNCFESSSEDDVLYYLTFGLQQQGLTGENGTLFVYDHLTSHSDWKNKILTKAALILELKNLQAAETAYLPYKYQQHCV